MEDKAIVGSFPIVCAIVVVALILLYMVYVVGRAIWWGWIRKLKRRWGAGKQPFPLH